MKQRGHSGYEGGKLSSQGLREAERPLRFRWIEMVQSGSVGSRETTQVPSEGDGPVRV